MDGGKLASAISMESLNSVSTESCPQVRTLFVSGLPMDAKPRELYLLFRAYRGYESSLLKMTAKNGKPTSPVGFVTFQTSKDADEARKALQGVRFDPDCAQVLRLELAKSNTKVSRPKQSPPPVIPMAAPSLQTMPQFLAPLQPADAILLDQHPLLFDQHQLFSLNLPRFPSAATQSLPLAGILSSDGGYHQNAFLQAALGLNAQNAASLQGCSTLFVANLSPGVTEDELRSVFKAFAGFTRLRMHTKNGSSVAFIEYSSLASATSAMMALQGFHLGSSERGGIRIEYARNKMADVNG
ncbi:RRM domain-containing protein [Trichostrongylus colubriformis]|uniref:RRM domain-containing protein n=1 Tax=Trichostrongylus colubriformis TaxID=6319 RepID=A0AAN8ITV0_TRICO